MTTHESSSLALNAISAEWVRTDFSSAERRDHLTNGGGLNGSYAFSAATLIDDQDPDQIQENDIQDWLVDAVAKAAATPMRFATRKIVPRPRAKPRSRN
jgi:hypothetical protein